MASGSAGDTKDVCIPVRAVKSPMDMAKWHKSQAFKRYTSYIDRLSESVRGKSCKDGQMSSPITNICKLLETLQSWMQLFPPQQNPQRFGNKAFRDWHNKLVADSSELLSDILPEELMKYVPEIRAYLLDSFGNPTRIDYGTDQDEISPSQLSDELIARKYDRDYLFMACIKYIHEVKTGIFAEHSNQLWNVSGVKTWNKINSGLTKMYHAEVLSKFPVVQHFVFGASLPIESELA